MNYGGYDEGILAALGAMVCVIGVIALIVWILEVIGYWKVFTKAGEAGWKSLIPFYNYYVQVKLCAPLMIYWIWLAATLVYFVLSFISGNSFVKILSMAAWLVIFVMRVFSDLKLSKAFGHGVGFAIGLILLEPIFLMILGFGSSQYDPSVDKESWY